MILECLPYIRTMIWGQERWLVSNMPQRESRFANPELKNCTFSQLITHPFPLLIKHLTTHAPLSIQVHPSDTFAQQHGETCGKTEMWYALQCDSNAELLVGLKHHLTPHTLVEHAQDGTILSDLQHYTVHEEDCFFLPAGRIHAIGSGCQLIEIQQPSDITYRLYDYHRLDNNGQPRPLHTALAQDCIDYTVCPDYQTHYQRLINTPITLAQCPYFETKLYHLTQPLYIDWTLQDRFLVVVITKGKGILTVDDEQRLICEGQTFLLPASTQHIHLAPTSYPLPTTHTLSFLTITS